MRRSITKCTELWQSSVHLVSWHYHDVIMGAIASQITSLIIVYTQRFIQAQIKENIKAPRHWPLCGEFTCDRWIPHTTNGQYRGKFFHLMTSSWNVAHISGTDHSLHEFCSCEYLSLKPPGLPRWYSSITLQWRHNGHDGVSNHQPHD